MKFNLFVIGVQKAGTTSLYEWLIQHPLICGDPSLKDVPFFTKERNQSEIKDFENKINKCDFNKQVKVTGCVDYIENINSLKRIKEYNEKAKIILILRNPYNRIISSYNFLRQLSLEKNEFFTDAINNNRDYLNRSLYYEKVKSLYEVFEKDEVKIILFEKMIDNPTATMKDVFSFLNLPQTENIEFYNANKTLTARFKMLNNLIFDKEKAVFIKKIFKSSFSPKTRVYLRRKVKNLNVSKHKEKQEYLFSNEIKDIITNDIIKLKKTIDLDDWRN